MSEKKNSNIEFFSVNSVKYVYITHCVIETGDLDIWFGFVCFSLYGHYYYDCVGYFVYYLLRSRSHQFEISAIQVCKEKKMKKKKTRMKKNTSKLGKVKKTKHTHTKTATVYRMHVNPNLIDNKFGHRCFMRCVLRIACACVCHCVGWRHNRIYSNWLENVCVMNFTTK